jgi:hypothetical protein
MKPTTAGTLVVAAVIALGAGLGIYNWWFQYDSARQIHAKWGTLALARIARSPRAELLVFYSSQGDVRNGAERQRSAFDITTAKGVTNLRYALGHDSSYEWPVPSVPPAEGEVEFAFRFSDNKGATTIAINPNARRAHNTASPDGVAQLTPAAAAGFKKFAAEQADEERRSGRGK